MALEVEDEQIVWPGGSRLAVKTLIMKMRMMAPMTMRMRMMAPMTMRMRMMGCTKNPISTLSHIWVFVRLYGIVFVIIVIIVIIIIMIIKSEGVNAQL